MNYAITNRAYLFSISLALIVLMALACTTTPTEPTPAEPTPNIDATVEARPKELVAEQVNNLRPNPDLAIEYFNRAGGYGQAGEWQLAIGDFTKAIQLGLDTFTSTGRNLLAEAYLLRGESYMELGFHQIRNNIETDHFQTAIDDFTKAIKLDPDYPLAHHNRAKAYFQQGLYAITDLDKACSLDSQYCCTSLRPC